MRRQTDRERERESQPHTHTHTHTHARTHAHNMLEQLDTKTPPLDEVDGEQVLHFYWIDAYELPFGNRTGAVYLFGKVFVESVGDYVSCCVTVRGLERNLFVLPRDVKLDARGQPTVSSAPPLPARHSPFVVVVVAVVVVVVVVAGFEL